jgi:hypothetical protein
LHAPGAYTPFISNVFEIFKNFKKIKKMLHVDVHILYAHEVVLRKTDFFVAEVKKDKKLC